MASIIKADDGSVSGVTGITSSADNSGILELQATANIIRQNVTGASGIAVGTTAQRPVSPSNGDIRINTTTGYLEVYYAGSWANIASAAALPTSVEILVVAGGGTGGLISSQRGSGGGAGGLISISSFPVSSGTYTATIGAGGASSSGTAVSNGANTTFSGNSRTLTALGGGSGGYNDGTNNGQAGGSGGGQWYPGYAGAAATQSSTVNDGISTYASSGFGNAGGTSGSSPPYGSGGGGAGGVGGNFNGASGPVGGVGRQVSISGSSVYYAGGGSSADYQGGLSPYAGGLGGGGTGSNSSYNTASNGTANTGGGGGSGGSGGSGIVILRHASNLRTGTVTGGGAITTSGGYTIYTFNSSGTVSW